MIIKPRKLFIYSIATIAILTTCILPTQAIEMTGTTAAQASESNRSYLDGAFVGWSGKGELITSVGTYSVANIYVNDRAGTRATSYIRGDKKPQVTLEFFSRRLIKVTIY